MKTTIKWTLTGKELPRIVATASSWPVLFRTHSGSVCCGYYHAKGYFHNEITDLPVYQVKTADVKEWVYLAELAKDTK